MGNAVQSILEQALRMPEPDRAMIAERLIASLDVEVDPDVDAAWQEEAQRRIDALDRGETECVPWESVRDRLRGNRRGATR